MVIPNWVDGTGCGRIGADTSTVEGSIHKPTQIIKHKDAQETPIERKDKRSNDQKRNDGLPVVLTLVSVFKTSTVGNDQGSPNEGQEEVNRANTNDITEIQNQQASTPVTRVSSPWNVEERFLEHPRQPRRRSSNSNSKLKA